jgi:hypothetical protein
MLKWIATSENKQAAMPVATAPDAPIVTSGSRSSIPSVLSPASARSTNRVSPHVLIYNRSMVDTHSRHIASAATSANADTTPSTPSPRALVEDPRKTLITNYNLLIKTLAVIWGVDESKVMGIVITKDIKSMKPCCTDCKLSEQQSIGLCICSAVTCMSCAAICESCQLRLCIKCTKKATTQPVHSYPPYWTSCSGHPTVTTHQVELQIKTFERV